MKNKVTIIDYDRGNIFSIANAISHHSADAVLSSSPKEIANADKLLLPGVGAFKDGMLSLKNKLIDDAIREFARTERPFLGICLGMQMMMDFSQEHGECQGLSMIPGDVAKIPSKNVEGKPIKIPHIGWNEIVGVHESNLNKWDETVLKGVPEKSEVYFVHSYSVKPKYKKHVFAYTFYGGLKLCSVIAHNNLFGCQFHPEKSGKVGLKIIKNFVEI